MMRSAKWLFFRNVMENGHRENLRSRVMVKDRTNALFLKPLEIQKKTRTSLKAWGFFFSLEI